MERSLDPELLGLALGQHGSLPSPGELSALMAQAELAILLQQPEASQELLATGWYLHGIATSKYALETYGIARQRAAFQVAGHLFDLFLRSPDLARPDRLKYCFAAQIAYFRGDLAPNAMAIYRRESALLSEHLRLIPDFGEIALSSGMALLGSDVDYIYQITGAIRDEVADLLASWSLGDILLTPFGAAAGVASGARDLMSFLLYGRLDLLERARSTLRSAVIADVPAQDHVSRWVAAHLLNLAADLERSSIWTVLPPEVPPSIRKAFAAGTPRVLALWPPQVDLVGATEPGVPNLLLPETKRLIISTPTSGGKTTIAQLLIASHLTASRTSVCYVAPTRTLCREVRRGLDQRLRFLAAEVTDGLPEGAWWDAYLAEPPGVEVMTPERLSFLIRSDPGRVLDQFGMFVFDEVHLVGERDRGWTLETALTYLHAATENSDHRIVLISAAIGNRNHFIQWMSQGDSQPFHCHSDWRGPRRISSLWTTDARWAEAREWVNPRARKNAVVQETPVYGHLQVRISHTGEIRHLATTTPVGMLVRHGPTADQLEKSGKSTPAYQMLIPVIQHLAEAGPVLVIVPRRQDTLLMARAIAGARAPIEATDIQGLVDLVQARLGAHPLRDILERGVAYHHGSLPEEIRASIEDAVAGGSVRILVATTTMTEGVNLPVQSVVITAQGAYGEQGYEEYITGPKLINAIGRAGRATKETEGVVVLARNALPSPSDFQRLNPSEEDMSITSVLASNSALDALADFEALQRAGQDAVLETSARLITDFLQFVWFIAAELDKMDAPVSSAAVADVLGRTLAWVQLAEFDRTRWLAAADALLQRFSATDKTVRRRWATSGASIGSARLLEATSRGLVEELRHSELPDDPVALILSVLDHGRLDRLLSLPEAPKARFYNHRAGAGRVQLPISHGDFLQQWLLGIPLSTLADTFLSGVSDVDFRYEQLGDYLNECFETYLPWVLATVVSWTNSLLAAEGSATQLPIDLPAYVRYGVGNRTALHLMVQGVLSRPLALQIAAVAVAKNIQGDLRAWIRSMTLPELRHTFDASRIDLRNLLEFAKDRRGDPAVALIQNGYVVIQIESYITDHAPAQAQLVPEDQSELPPIQVQVDAEVVGHVPVHFRADVLALLKSGLGIITFFSAQAGEGRLEFRLVEPE